MANCVCFSYKTGHKKTTVLRVFHTKKAINRLALYFFCTKLATNRIGLCFLFKQATNLPRLGWVKKILYKLCWSIDRLYPKTLDCFLFIWQKTDIFNVIYSTGCIFGVCYSILNFYQSALDSFSLLFSYKIHFIKLPSDWVTNSLLVICYIVNSSVVIDYIAISFNFAVPHFLPWLAG